MPIISQRQYKKLQDKLEKKKIMSKKKAKRQNKTKSECCQVCNGSGIILASVILHHRNDIRQVDLFTDVMCPKCIWHGYMKYPDSCEVCGGSGCFRACIGGEDIIVLCKKCRGAGKK